VLEAFSKSILSRGEISPRKLASVLEFWVPLTLVSLGLVLTFRAGLWNIGVEGQMMVGGLFAAGVAFAVPLDSPLLMVPLVIAGALVGGGLWALLAGFLKTRFGVNEIFSGVALNALANQLTLQLIAGAWKPTDSEKAQYSRDIPDAALLAPFSPDFQISPLALVLVAVAVVVVVIVLWRSRWGLNLKATGNNARSALLLGVPVSATALGAMIACGALAGIGGAHRVLFTYENVRGQFSGGIGFLGLLVVLLLGMRWRWTPVLVPVVTLLFAVMLSSGAQLQFIGVDDSLIGVLQGVLVLVIFLGTGLRDRLTDRLRPVAAEAPAPEAPNPDERAAAHSAGD
jgi:simple sugar transport system permease protein